MRKISPYVSGLGVTISIGSLYLALSMMEHHKPPQELPPLAYTAMAAVALGAGAGTVFGLKTKDRKAVRRNKEQDENCLTSSQAPPPRTRPRNRA